MSRVRDQRDRIGVKSVSRFNEDEGDVEGDPDREGAAEIVIVMMRMARHGGSRSRRSSSTAILRPASVRPSKMSDISSVVHLAII